MSKTAIILAGGVSRRFGQDKGLISLAGKPLVMHVFEKACLVAEELIVVVGSATQRDLYLPLFPKGTKIVVDAEELRSPLVGALSGFTSAGGDYSVLLPCDTPFVSKEVMDLLFHVAPNMDAVIPRWPNAYIEPLQAVYRTSSTLRAAQEALDKGEVRLLPMIMLLKKVRYISTMVIQEINPRLTTFFNINTPTDLRRAENLIKRSTVM